MSVTPTRNFTRLAAAMVVAALVIGAAIFASSYLATAAKQTVTKTEVKTTTTTLTPSAELEPNGSLLMTMTWGQWVFTVLMNSTSVRLGGALLVSGELTYLGQTNTMIAEAEPIVGLSVYNSTGALVWEYTPPGAIFPNAPVTPGETLGGSICVPISTTLPSGAQNRDCEFAFRQQPSLGVYSIYTAPTFYSATGSYSSPENPDLGHNLGITANFTIF